MPRKKKNTKTLKIVVLSIFLVILLVFSPLGAQLLSVISPGFEGAKCYFYGADFRFNSDWDGTYQLHKYQDAEDPLVYHELYGSWDKIYWTTVATPNDAGIGWHTHLWPDTDRAKPSLGVHVESNIQLQDINRQGDPLHWNDTEPMTGRRIEYWSKKAVKVDETEDKVTYHYTVSKETFLVVPAEFWLGFYLVPSESDAGTGSGWREGEWGDTIVSWFMLDWTVWDNAYKDSWLDDPEVNVFDTMYDGEVLNKEKTWEYRGGFPIAGWIQGWEKAGWTSDFGADESPLWFETRSSESKIYTVEQLADLKDALMSKVQFAPSLVGQFISLYNEPSASFNYEADMYESSDFSNPDAITKYVESPDSRMKKTMYFPINILNFGTYADPTGFLSWRVFYPSCYFRIRVLYGVYGKFLYLWSEELAKDPTVDYPDEIERHGTLVIHQRSTGLDWLTSWLTSIFSNPFFLFLIILICVIVLIVLLAIFVPGVLTLASQVAKTTGETVKQKRKKTKYSPYPLVNMKTTGGDWG